MYKLTIYTIYRFLLKLKSFSSKTKVFLSPMAAIFSGLKWKSKSTRSSSRYFLIIRLKKAQHSRILYPGFFSQILIQITFGATSTPRNISYFEDCPPRDKTIQHIDINDQIKFFVYWFCLFFVYQFHHHIDKLSLLIFHLKCFCKASELFFEKTYTKWQHFGNFESLDSRSSPGPDFRY